MRFGSDLFRCLSAGATFVCLTSSCGDIATPHDAVIAVLGEISDAGDDKFSVATCPRDTVVVRCSCPNYNQCDGTEVIGQKCVAVIQHLSPRIQAVALCRRGNASDYEYVSESAGERPLTNCSAGFEAIACSVRNPASNIYCCYPKMSQDGKSCGLREERGRWSRCIPNAICRWVMA